MARVSASMAVVAALLVVGALPMACAGLWGGADATELNAQALEKAYAGKLKEALPLFRQAAEAAPTSPEYLNNLGVTYMRLGELEEARVTFNKALELDPRHADVTRNIEELEMLSGDSLEEEQHEIEHTLLDVPRIPVEDLYAPHNADYARGLKPFMLTGAMTHPKWQRAMRVWSADYFAQHYPNSLTDFYPHNMDKEKVRPFLVPWTEALQEYRHPTSKYPRSRRHPGTYIQWNLGEAEWQWIREHEIGPLPDMFVMDEAWLRGCLKTEALRDEYAKGTHWRMVLIGTEGAGMFNHKDTLRTSSFQAQVKGSKTWHICAPEQDRFMYGAGAVDFFNPDYRRFPLALNATCYKYTLRAGEMMFYPRDWWHQTYNEEGENIAVSGTIADGNNFDSISEELSKDASRSVPIILSPSQQLRDALPGCYQWLQQAFAPSLA